MKKSDVPIVFELLNKHLKAHRLNMVFTPEEVDHFFLPRQGVIHSYVVEDAHSVTDFFSFYSLPSSILKHAT